MQGFKIGDKVVCNDSTNIVNFTCGEVYTVVGFDPWDIHLDLINDNCKPEFCIPNRFTVLNNPVV